jgi:hypothetical protein
MSKRIKIFNFLLLLVFLQPAFNNIAAQQYTEYEVKAGYLYNFVRFISWPEGSFANSSSPIVIGIYGSDRFGEIIRRTIRNNTVDGRTFVIKYYNHPSQIQQCHILFVSEISRTELIDLLRIVRKKPILTVGDNLEGFCQMGGIINFTPQYSRNRFEINNTTARNNEINISSKLLSLAKIVTINEVEF